MATPSVDSCAFPSPTQRLIFVWTSVRLSAGNCFAIDQCINVKLIMCSKYTRPIYRWVCVHVSSISLKFVRLLSVGRRCDMQWCVRIKNYWEDSFKQIRKKIENTNILILCLRYSVNSMDIITKRPRGCFWFIYVVKAFWVSLTLSIFNSRELRTAAEEQKNDLL